MTSIQQNLVVPNPENAQSNQNQPPAASSPSKLRLKQALQDLKAEEAQKHEKLISLVEQVVRNWMICLLLFISFIHPSV